MKIQIKKYENIQKKYIGRFDRSGDQQIYNSKWLECMKS